MSGPYAINRATLFPSLLRLFSSFPDFLVFICSQAPCLSILFMEICIMLRVIRGGSVAFANTLLRQMYSDVSRGNRQKLAIDLGCEHGRHVARDPSPTTRRRHAHAEKPPPRGAIVTALGVLIVARWLPVRRAAHRAATAVLKNESIRASSFECAIARAESGHLRGSSTRLKHPYHPAGNLQRRKRLPGTRARESCVRYESTTNILDRLQCSRTSSFQPFF